MSPKGDSALEGRRPRQELQPPRAGHHMAYKACKNCGTRIYNNTCPNCQEELYIVETQSEDLPPTLSPEFSRKVSEQRAERRQRIKEDKQCPRNIP